MKTCDNPSLKEFILDLCDDAGLHAENYPVDRQFILNHLTEIQLFDSVEFLFYNFELLSSLYVNQLFFCLPEAWENISVDNIQEMVESFTHVYPYYSLLQFAYKYLEIDIIDL